MASANQDSVPKPPPLPSQRNDGDPDLSGRSSLEAILGSGLSSEPLNSQPAPPPRAEGLEESTPEASIPEASAGDLEDLEASVEGLDASADGPDAFTAASAKPDEPATESDKDRRAHPRIGLEAEIDFHGPDNFYTGFAEDISEGGLFVSTYQLLETGTEVDVHFSLPGGFELDARAVVRWVRHPRGADSDTPPGMGLKFLELTDEQQALVNRFIAKREPLFYEE